MSNYAELLPALSSEEFDALKASIKLEGVRDPVAVDEAGNVLDGRHRLKIDPKAPRKIIKGLSDGEKQAYVFSSNMSRRNLSADQKSECHEKMKAVALALKTEDPKKNTQSRIGGLLGVSQDTISHWLIPNTQMRNGYKNLDARVKLSKDAKAEIVRRVLAGESQASVAADYKVSQKTISKLMKRHEREQSNRANRKAANIKVVTSVKLIQSDALEFLASLPKESADLLLTDPPYSTDVEDIFAFSKSWFSLALSRLKPSGRAYVFTGAYIDELNAYTGLILKLSGWRFDPPLVWTYRNTMGPTPKMGYKLNWQACFHLYGPKAAPLDCESLNERFTVQNINAPDARNDIRDHAWQKPDDLADRLIKHAGLSPGATVIDPFAGTGTFVSAAARAGFNMLACDNDQKMLKLCIKRGLEISNAI